MKKQFLVFLITVLLSTAANAQFKIHQNGQVSFQSLTTSNGVQIDTAGVTSFEPNLSTSYCRIVQTKVNTNYAKAWIVVPSDPAVSTGDNFYVLGRGDIYGGSLYSIPGNGGGGNHNSKKTPTIDNATEILSSLNGYYLENHEFDGFVPDFEDNPEIDPEAIPGLLKDMEINKVAVLDTDELEVVFPEAVRHDPQGRVGVNYSALIPVIIEAYKEQQAKIEQLEAILEENGLLKP